MSDIHANPATNGTVFGKATVTVDLDAGDCVVHSFRQGPIGLIPRSMRLHSIDEIPRRLPGPIWIGCDRPDRSGCRTRSQVRGSATQSTSGG